MARESKRKRDEKRFGKPERLADALSVASWLVPDDLTHKDLPDVFPELVQMATVIDAQNIVEYVRGGADDKEWRWTELPCCRLPFALLFVEFKCSFPWPDIFARTGILLAEVDTAVALDKVSEILYRTPGSSLTTRMGSDIAMLRERAELAIDFGLVAQLGGSNNPHASKIVHLCGGSLFLDRSGVPLRSPFGQIDRTLFPSVDDMRAGSRFMWWTMFPALMSISFMHCKNVSIQALEPNQAINRERKKAGLKPFVRYHTINIEPMKKVLRTEGNIETEGLKKALHICRGHFATYSEEKPLFGRVAGTFWVPAHTRGSLKQGIVVSDYNVKAPKS